MHRNQGNNAFAMLIYMLGVAAVAAIVGFLIRRAWLFGAVALLAAGHVAFILVTGQSNHEDTPAMLAMIAFIYLHTPALLGAALGTLLGLRFWPSAGRRSSAA